MCVDTYFLLLSSIKITRFLFFSPELSKSFLSLDHLMPQSLFSACWLRTVFGSVPLNSYRVGSCVAQGTFSPTGLGTGVWGYKLNPASQKALGLSFPSLEVLCNPFLQESSDLDKIFSASGGARKNYQRGFQSVSDEQSGHSSGIASAARTDCFQIFKN